MGPGERLERLQRDVDRWDVLVSPNRASTPLLRGAFRFDGEVLESGYPRNDVLLAPDRDAVRARVRAELGIPDGVRAVLFAPTWRDDVVFMAATTRSSWTWTSSARWSSSATTTSCCCACTTC